MGRKKTGSIIRHSGGFSAQITIDGKRETIQLPHGITERDARVKAAFLSEVHEVLATASPLQREEGQKMILEAANESTMKKVLSHARSMIADRIANAPTIQSVGELWTSGALADKYPDHAKRKLSVNDDRWRLQKHVYPVVGHVPIEEFTLADAQKVMSKLTKLTPASRRQVAQLMVRICKLAVFPMAVLKASPLPEGFLPKVGEKKAKQYLYPNEEAVLASCDTVPIGLRFLYAFLAREGLRISEATRLEWTDFAFHEDARGILRLDINKTSDPRAWAMGEDVVRALKIWRSLHPDTKFVFVDEAGEVISAKKQAEPFRAHLRKAGVTRKELFEDTSLRKKIRVHDLRATFVTLALADGKTETWISDRTGHRSSAMIANYRRAARSVSEVGLGWLLKMDELLFSQSHLNRKLDSEVSEGDDEESSSLLGIPKVGVEPTLCCQNRILRAKGRKAPKSKGSKKGTSANLSEPTQPVCDSVCNSIAEAQQIHLFLITATRAALEQDEQKCLGAMLMVLRVLDLGGGK